MFSQRNKTMGSVSFVLLLILVWTFQTVCEDECFNQFNITCEDVTGKVGETLNLTCSISYQCSKCCMKFYKFYNPAEFCRKEFPKNSCEQKTSITCPYTLNATTTTKFKLFLISCGRKSAEFTVNITDIKDNTKDVTSAAETDQSHDKSVTDVINPDGPDRSKVAVIAAVVSGFIIIIIITVTIIYKKKRNCSSLPECFRSTDMMTDNSII
ncbi:uncharacterized protein LOC127423614 isoform X3 [Myxocyprinus asiaticus]|uniref:uncharacterized protein LOC127423614 isoform X1 n=1 Tax=Myxocyprinus asiaticus TaxID=70543 RepID=UPI002221E662|nr:uncharacterized protein LOC127423614 isoform X1 [Myxocyprinus asiaticus]XP_051524044.1 uncharacterized protein LOC127423614 isoform X2 [Myxocyprinus asiaticus]XP_051524045.1 uncharacterized protein LOC127423614 isoform X3 [Myxocyprinus asiaticus]